MTERKTYRLNDLVAQCDPCAPMPEAVQEWDQAVSVGLEQTVMSGQVDIRNAVLVFHGPKLSEDEQATFAERFGPLYADNRLLVILWIPSWRWLPWRLMYSRKPTL